MELAFPARHRYLCHVPATLYVAAMLSTVLGIAYSLFVAGDVLEGFVETARDVGCAVSSVWVVGIWTFWVRASVYLQSVLHSRSGHVS